MGNNIKEQAKLTDKQKVFCEEYMIDLNATQAAKRAGYSEKTAKDIGCQNLAKLNIQAYISELMDVRSKKAGITALDVLQELKNYAYSDITETMELDFSAIKNLPIEIRRLIISFEKSVTTFEGGEKTTYKIKFVDKMRAFEMINKHIGFYEIDNKQKESSNIVIFEIPSNGREKKD